MAKYRCNPGERLFCLVNDLHRGEGMISSGIRIRGSVDEQRLREALARLQARHGKLRSGIEYDKQGWPWFVELEPAVPIACEFRETADPAEAEEVLLHAWPDAFPIDRSPPVQLIVLRCPAAKSTDIIGWFHHSVFDGPAVWQFFDELLQAYADPDALREPAPGGFELRPRGRITPWGNLLWLLKIVWYRLVLGGFQPTKTFCQRPVTGTVYRRKVLSPEFTRRIVAACRRNEATVTSAVSAAGCQALAEEFSWHGAPIAMPTPRDVRGDFDPPVAPGTLGCFNAIYEVVMRLPTKEEDFWSVARRYTREAQEQFAWKDPIRGLHLVKHLPVGLLKKAGTQRGALIVNNLGRVSIGTAPHGPELLDYYGYSRTRKIGASALVLTAGTTNDKMSVALTTGCFEQGLIDRLLEKIVDALDRATQPVAEPREDESSAAVQLVSAS